MQKETRFNWKTTLVITILAFVLGCGATVLAYNYQASFITVHRSPKLVCNVFVSITTPEDTVTGESGNLVTNIGETAIRNLLGFDNISSYAPFKYLSLGNATPAVTLTKLTTEATTNGLARATGTVVSWNNGTDSAFNVTYTWTVTGLGSGVYIAVQTAGCHWNDTGNSDSNMAACAYLTDGAQHQLTDGSTVTVTWCWTVDAN